MIYRWKWEINSFYGIVSASNLEGAMVKALGEYVNGVKYFENDFGSVEIRCRKIGQEK